MPFDTLYVPAYLGQFLQGEHHSYLLLVRSGRDTEDLRLRRDIARHSTLRADRDLIRDTHLAGHDNVIASARRARDADLTAQDVMLPDLAVMADHHQVVDFRSRSDAGDAECSPIDRAASPNFDVVLDLDRSQL